MKRRPLRQIVSLFMLLTCLLVGGVRGKSRRHQATSSRWPSPSCHSGCVRRAPLAVGYGWRIEKVDTTEGVGAYSSLAFDSTGRPHISYYDFLHGDLKYAYKDDSGWHIETIQSTGNVGGYTSLAIDALDQPNISYCLLQSGSTTQCDDLWFAIKLNGIWLRQAVDSAGFVGGYTSLAVEGGPRWEDMEQHISYYDHSHHTLKYCLGTGAIWRCPTVDSTGDVGTAHLAWRRRRPSFHRLLCRLPDRDLKYAHYDGSHWSTQTLDSDGNAGFYTSLALCRRPGTPGTPYITYYGDGDLKYTHKWFGFDVWTTPFTLDSDPPGPTSLALDSNCLGHVSYFQQFNGDLRYTHRMATASTLKQWTAKGMYGLIGHPWPWIPPTDRTSATMTTATSA